MPAHTDFSASSSAAVLEPNGVHPRPLGQAMKKVVDALSEEQSKSSRVYGVVVYSKHHKEPEPNYLNATGKFFRAYLRSSQALSQITHLVTTSPEKDHLETLETKEFGDVRVFRGKATLKDIKPSPGVYIFSLHLDASLLRDLHLPLLPKPVRQVPLVIQVKTTDVAEGAELKKRAWRQWEDDAEALIKKDSLEWRKQFMSNFECLTAAQIAEETTSLAKNRAAIASRWVAEKKIFGIEFEGQKRFPRFQFQDGRPISAVSEVIERFPEHTTGWDLAYFFVTPNPNVSGRVPIELLKEDPARVVSLAQAFAHPADVF
jgi:hypothetical protein